MSVFVKDLILVTGGLGFIGSHTVVELMQSGFGVVVIDNLSNSHEQVADTIRQLVARFYIERDGDDSSAPRLSFHLADVNDRSAISSILARYSARLHGVIHFAALKAVSDSIKKPLEYYKTNIVGLLNVLEAMQESGVKTLLYSSSATVYGSLSGSGKDGRAHERMCHHRAHDSEEGESDGIQGSVGITNPYGRTKWMGEAILDDVCNSDPQWSITALRYFNPVGAHKSGLLGEDPRDVPNNLMPCILRVMDGRWPQLQIYGSDYPTPDGTAIRDFIHVVDLAKGHVAAIIDAAKDRQRFVTTASQAHAALKSPLPTTPPSQCAAAFPTLDEVALARKRTASNGSVDGDSETSCYAGGERGTRTPGSDSASDVSSLFDTFHAPGTPTSPETPGLALNSPGSCSSQKRPDYFASSADDATVSTTTTTSAAAAATTSNELRIFNLGAGRGISVSELLEGMRVASGIDIPAVRSARRQGDVVISIADPSKAERELGWKATNTLQDICNDTFRHFQSHAQRSQAAVKMTRDANASERCQQRRVARQARNVVL